MKLSDCKPGQPVEVQNMRGLAANQNGNQGYLADPEPDQYGLYTVDFLLKPATRKRDAVTRRLRLSESKLKVLTNEKPPKNFEYFFTAKDYRYCILPSGEQPQQKD